MNHIDIAKISNDSKLITVFNFVKDNKQYYDHWTNEWSYDKPKEDLINQLRGHYKSFSALKTKNTETYLLLGDIAHYLYNMDDTAYYSIAVKNYDEAVKSSPKDFRVYWFLGYHYALSNVPTSAIDNFLEAEKILPTQQPADFWNDYAWATAVTNMPSHCIYAMDKVKSISGNEGSFQQQLGETIYKRIVPVDKNQSYDKKDIWTASQSDKTTFTSRPLGIKIIVDSIWDLQIYDYQKNQAVFIMNPPKIANKKRREISYTIALIMKTANDKDKLSDYINVFVSKYTDKKQIAFSDKYDKIIAYEIKDKTMYQDIGGGHLYMIGIERDRPKYAGLLLENPVSLPKGNSNEITYYRASDSKDRFKGKIFYAIMLDSCEDINEQSFSIFKSLFDNQIIIE
ncbi:MAG: hypothetical protein KF900_07620 [Bacteroidetes bacterium]|nr:hypothetical protein [Bacteroidota bacterium]